MILFTDSYNALHEVTCLLIRNRHLTVEMARREISDRYSGQVFGVLWAFGHPLFLMVLYVFIFAFVFKTKLGGSYEMPLDYTTYILAGLVPWLAFQDSLIKTCSSITGNVGLVKQIIFPLEILPCKGVLASLVPQLVSMFVLIGYVVLTQNQIFYTCLLLPVVVFIQILTMLGVGFFLSAVGAYFKDMKDLVQLFALVSMYLMPVFYLPDMVPRYFKPVLYANPFSHLIWCYQDLIYFGRFAHPVSWVIAPLFGFLVFIFGYRVFRKLKTNFGNVV